MELDVPKLVKKKKKETKTKKYSLKGVNIKIDQFVYASRIFMLALSISERGVSSRTTSSDHGLPLPKKD